MSIAGNVRRAFCRTFRIRPRSNRREALRGAALWDEAKQLNQPGHVAVGRQQQRLCIGARSAVEPEVALMDRPTSSLDPFSTASVEDLWNRSPRNTRSSFVTPHAAKPRACRINSAFMLSGEDGIGHLSR